MSARVDAVRGWLRRTFAWSNTPAAWAERLSLAGVLAAVVGLAVYGAALAPWQQVLGWAVLVIAAAALFRRGWLRLFGPVLWFDLLRTARRGRTYLVRAGYLLGILLVLWLMYLNAWPARHGREPTLHDLARFGQLFFWAFVAAQFAFLVLVTPAFTAGAVAEENQKKTLPFLLASDLRSGEIVLGKLAARLAHLGLLLLAGLPVLAAVQLLGGVDPHLVLAAFAGATLAVASAAGVGVLASVLVRTPRAAVVLAYAAVAGYALLCLLGEAAPAWWLPKKPFYASAPANFWEIETLIEIVEAGNPVVAVYRTLNSSGRMETALLQALGAYALFHGTVAVGCTVAATALLRPAARREPPPPAAGRSSARGAVGDWPMVWKEAHARRGWRRWAARLCVGLLVGLSLWPATWLPARDLSAGYSLDAVWADLGRGLNVWVRSAGTALACLGLLGVVMRAAFSFRVERERDTLDGLLTTPLGGAEIIGGKWLGAVLGGRGMLLWLGFVWVLAALGGGLSVWAVALLLPLWCVYVAAAASVGLWFSLVSRTSLRAVLYTVLAGLGLWFGHWLVWLVCLPLGVRGGHAMDAVLKAQVGLTPPAALAVAAFHPDDMRLSFFGDAAPFLLVGAACWAFFAGIVFWLTLARFRKEFGPR
jgi:ABC-type transport system involved in multi-copper enzyme maturation permease subunit